jgi:predicted metal-dependent hydrolase
VTFLRRKGTRRIKISVEPFKGVRVSVPYRVSLRVAEAFLNEKQEWIQKQIAWVKQIEQEHAERISTAVPLDRKAAAVALKSRVAELAERFNFIYSRVSVRAQRTRWGSCSRANNINLNIQLMRLPDDLRDYVIMHELTHTKVKNHSREFWGMLDQAVTGAKAFDRRLRSYHTWLL